MGNGRSLPPHLSGCLWLRQAVSHLHFSKSSLANGKVNEYSAMISPGSAFSLVGTLLCVPLPFSLYIEGEKEWQGCD